MRRLSVLALMLTVIAASTAAWANDRYTLLAEAVPACIVADGKSYSQIIISVLDSQGMPAPDGTEVKVSTTAGSVTTVAYAGSGRATAILTSTSSPAVAAITCSAGISSTSVQVEFSAFPGISSLGPRLIRMEGGSLAYSVEKDVVLGSDGVSIDYDGLIINASNAQVCEQMGVIKAQGALHITRGDDVVEADALIYDLRTDKCRLLRQGLEHSGTASSLFKQDKLKQPGTPSSSNFSPLTADDTKTWIVANKLSMFPRERIQFTSATVYMGNTRVLTFPHYIFDYSSRSALMDQIRYTKYEGLVADIPMYYSVTDSGTGALKLRYAQKGSEYGGYFKPRKGPSVGLEQAYSFGERNEGRLFVDALSDSSRSLELAHHQEFGSFRQNGRADFSLRYQPTSTYAKGLYTAYVNANMSLSKYDCYLSGYTGGSKTPMWDPENPESMNYEPQASSSMRATLKPRKSISLGNMSFAPNLSLGYGRLGFGSANAINEGLYQSVGLTFRAAPIGSRLMNLSIDGSSEMTIADNGKVGTGLRLSTMARRTWKGGSASLGYALNLRSGPVANMFSSSVHAINGTLFAGLGTKWNCFAYFGYGLDTGRLNLSSSGMYQVNDKWKVRADYSLYRYKFSSSTYSFTSEMSYLKAGIYRPLGPYEVGIAWSPTGQQSWSGKGKKLWLEFGMAGF